MARSRNHFTLTRTNDSITVADNTSAEDIDALSGIERIRFADTALAFDTDGNAGKAYRLYQAAFNRAPDLPGLGYWISHLDKGMGLTEVAYCFEMSTEFQSLYGTNLSNAQLITLLYRNALHREPDAEGFNYWLDVMDTGRKTRPEMLINFSESAENKAQIIGSIQNGIEYTLFA